MMTKYIRIDNNIRAVIQEQMNAPEVTITAALRFRRNGEVSERIRSLALELGGAVYYDLPQDEAIHDVDGKMYQYFSNGVVLVADKCANQVELMREDSLIAVYHNVTLALLASIQRYADSLS